MSIKNRQILLKGAEGDEKAIRQIWDIWSPRLVLYYRSSLPERDIEDLVQDSMFKIYKSLSSYNPAYAPSTWIYTIASRTKTDWLRHHSRLNTREDHSEGSEIHIANSLSPFPGPEDSFFQSEDQKKVRGFLREQNPENREILYLHCYEDLSGRAVARVLDLPYETVRYRLKCLKKNLKERMTL